MARIVLLRLLLSSVHYPFQEIGRECLFEWEHLCSLLFSIFRSQKKTIYLAISFLLNFGAGKIELGLNGAKARVKIQKI